MDEFDDFINETIEDLKGTGEAFWNQLNEDQRPIVERATRRLADLTALRITDPANAATHEQDIQHVLNTLLSEASLTGTRAEAQVRAAVGRVIVRGTGLIWGFLPPQV